MNKIEEAFNNGFRVNKEGQATNPRGEITAGTNRKGYMVITVRKSRTRNDAIPIHRLQAFQKYGDKLFEEGIVVRHKNGKTFDNSWQNILIGSHSDNMMDIPEAIRLSKALHATSFVKKHKHQDIIDFHVSNGNSYKKTMAEFSLTSKGTLNFILKKSNSQRESNPQPSPS